MTFVLRLIIVLLILLSICLPKLIKEVAEILIDPLVHIFNLSGTTPVVNDKLNI